MAERQPPAPGSECLDNRSPAVLGGLSVPSEVGNCKQSAPGWLGSKERNLLIKSPLHKSVDKTSR